MPEEPGNGQEAGGGAPRPSVGAMLRAERERRGVSMDEAAAQLRIRRVHLDAIEGNRFKELPGAPYAVGFVRAYADFLQLDRDEIVRRFKVESSGLESRKELSFPRPLSESRLPGGVVMLISALIAVGAYAVWYFHSTAERAPLPRVAALPERLAPLADPVPVRTPEPPPVAAPAAESLAAPTEPETTHESASASPGTPTTSMPSAAPAAPMASPAVVAAPVPAAPRAEAATPAVSMPEPTASVAPAPAAASAPPSPPVAVAPARTEGPPLPPSDAPPSPRSYGEATGQSRIVLRAMADSWIQVRDGGGNIVFARVLRPGDSYNVPNRRGLMLHTGNAGVLEVQVDGQPAPPVGKVGVVKRDIALDPERLIAGNADQSRPSAGEPPAPSGLPRSGAQGG